MCMKGQNHKFAHWWEILPRLTPPCLTMTILVPPHPLAQQQQLKQQVSA